MRHCPPALKSGGLNSTTATRRGDGIPRELRRDLENLQVTTSATKSESAGGTPARPRTRPTRAAFANFRLPLHRTNLQNPANLDLELSWQQACLTNIETPQSILPYASDSPHQSERPTKVRVDSIDLVARHCDGRDDARPHSRTIFTTPSSRFDPLDPTRTNVALFFTRWITHFCAPTFVASGWDGHHLQFARGKARHSSQSF